MLKLKKSERIAVITKILCENPNKTFPLYYFCKLLSAAKSSISEDIKQIGICFDNLGLGKISTSVGINGGAKYIPLISKEEAYRSVFSLSSTLSSPERLLTGGYVYWSDILCEPSIVNKMGKIIATEFIAKQPSFVLTMETKGIPLAYSSAQALGIPLVVARRNVNVYEGSSVNISYINIKGNIETMALPRRAVKAGNKALIVDDVIRAGGTARGMITLMREFDVDVIGNAFLLAEEDPEKCYVKADKPLMLFSFSAEKGFSVRPAPWLRGE